MTTELPSVFKRPSSADVLPGEPILASDWQTMVEGQHWLWTRQISHLSGAEFAPTWTTTSGSYTQTPIDDEARPLDAVTLWGRPKRPDTNSDLVLEFVAVATDADIKYSIYQDDQSSLITDLTQSTSTGSSQRVRSTATISASGVTSSGTIRPIRVEVEAKTNASKATISQIDVYESAITTPTRIS
jgi:hypothetical protein